MDEARNFKFGVRIDLGKSHLISDKIPSKGAWSGFRAEFLNFNTPYLNLERVKLETSNSVHGSTMTSPISSMTKYHIWGFISPRGRILKILGPPA